MKKVLSMRNREHERPHADGEQQAATGGHQGTDQPVFTGVVAVYNADRSDTIIEVERPE